MSVEVDGTRQKGCQIKTFPCPLLDNIDCLKDKSIDCQNCSVLYCVTQLFHSHQHTHVLTSDQAPIGLSLGLVHCCFLDQGWFA